ncbi:uncharacterized protein LOC122851157 [Aphidius gifuensis]|uniref:uncharacterized protein LOC122851157 n=1 Tax=Aphidius gifuensis TaxID=684658 RepID=UPI001CDC8672|nr:uncharacterized protein LOC122851157 [Aphidius gifuensis]XP_044006149.1 uncharacterized protein LOC122851157 [Aphidius gifuensis]
MPTTPLKFDMFDAEARPRDWDPKPVTLKGPLRIARLCIFGMLLPALLVTGPIYLRYRVYAEQLYPLAASDQRLIDGKISTTWCQRQIVKVNTTFNAYLINGNPQMKIQPTILSMTRHLILKDDMKEYWGFYLLSGSSVTVSTCVRWPGASLTIIRGHKHLQECAFIGDDSSEEVDEILENTATTQKELLNGTGYEKMIQENGQSNLPGKMKRARFDVEFHHKANAPYPNATLPKSQTSDNSNDDTSHELDGIAMKETLSKLFAKSFDMKNRIKSNQYHREGVFRDNDNIERPPIMINSDELLWETESVIDKIEQSNNNNNNNNQTSSEVFHDILKKIKALGDDRGKHVLQQLMKQSDNEKTPKNITDAIKKVILDSNESNNNNNNNNLIKIKRHVVLKSSSSPEIVKILNQDDQDDDVGIENEDLNPDGIAEDRGTVNETTLNDKSNSEFWSSFSSSEERLLECKGLILNLPLTPHHYCSKKYEHHHSTASVANTVTYRVPVDGYYFFVFSSENEIQPNYIRIKFDLVKKTYNTSNSVHSCQNSTNECSLPFNFFSWEKTVLELPLTGNDSQWNEDYVVVSRCEPRTSLYLICIISVPILILIFAFH